jgi:hypothetical protein
MELGSAASNYVCPESRRRCGIRILILKGIANVRTYVRTYVYSLYTDEKDHICQYDSKSFGIVRFI